MAAAIAIVMITLSAKQKKLLKTIQANGLVAEVDAELDGHNGSETVIFNVSLKPGYQMEANSEVHCFIEESLEAVLERLNTVCVCTCKQCHRS
jgi:hypothetical protein